MSPTNKQHWKKKSVIVAVFRRGTRTSTGALLPRRESVKYIFRILVRVVVAMQISRRYGMPADVKVIRISLLAHSSSK